MNPDHQEHASPQPPPLSTQVVPSYVPLRPRSLVTVLKWVQITVFSGIAVTLVVGLWGNARWTRSTQSHFQALEAATLAVPQRPERYNEEDLANLPPVVRRYFAKVLNPNQPLVRRLYLEQTGTFNRSFQKERWEPFTARQRVSTRRAGFVWDASITLWPAITVRVVDAYVAGVGSLQPSVFGLLDLGGSHGTPEMARGELIRFFAEAVWYPTALLPSQGVQWTGLDEQSAQAKLTDGALSVTLTFHFDSQGLVSRIVSTERSALVDGAMLPMPWEVRVSRYQAHSGMLVPHEAEVAWVPLSGRVPYWRGKIEKLDYELPR